MQQVKPFKQKKETVFSDFISCEFQKNKMDRLKSTIKN